MVCKLLCIMSGIRHCTGSFSVLPVRSSSYIISNDIQKSAAFKDRIGRTGQTQQCPMTPIRETAFKNRIFSIFGREIGVKKHDVYFTGAVLLYNEW